jgi:hypothetical protein
MTSGLVIGVLLCGCVWSVCLCFCVCTYGVCTCMIYEPYDLYACTHVGRYVCVCVYSQGGTVYVSISCMYNLYACTHVGREVQCPCPLGRWMCSGSAHQHVAAVCMHTCPRDGTYTGR